eukprot:762674-Hanusia_phi.AAC.4
MDADTGVRDDEGVQGWIRDYYRNFVIFETRGMLGDLGLYIPLVVTLSLRKQVAKARFRMALKYPQIGLAPTLIFSGLSNIITG